MFEYMMRKLFQFFRLTINKNFITVYLMEHANKQAHFPDIKI